MKRKFWTLIVVMWTILGLFMTSQIMQWSRRSGRGLQWHDAVVFELSYCALWIALTPAVVWLCRRFHLIGRRWLLHSFIHLAAAVAMSMATMSVRTILAWVFIEGMSEPLTLDQVVGSLFQAMDYGIMSYMLIVVVAHAFDYYRKLRERELHASQLEARLMQAQIQSLKMQLQPHFLFNTLHTVANLMRTHDNGTAIQMLSALSDLLRNTLSTGNDQEISLKKEIEILKSYVKIQQIRFRDRLHVTWQIAPDTLDARVPNMILQPLTENAIQHGITPLGRPGEVAIRAERSNGDLHLAVSDDGRGLLAGHKEGIGLSNTRARLEKLYGSQFRFEIDGQPGHGTTVDLWIPYSSLSTSGTCV